MLMRGRVEAERAKQQQPIPLGMRLDQELEKAGAYSRIEDTQRRGFLQTFLTTPQSMGDIARATNGQWSVGGVRKTLYASMQRVFPVLPEDTRQSLVSAEEAIKKVATDEVKEEARREKIKAGWKVEKPRQMSRKKPGEDKMQFSPDHHTHLSEAASRREQRKREMRQAQTATTDQ